MFNFRQFFQIQKFILLILIFLLLALPFAREFTSHSFGVKTNFDVKNVEYPSIATTPKKYVFEAKIIDKLVGTSFRNLQGLDNQSIKDFGNVIAVASGYTESGFLLNEKRERLSTFNFTHKGKKSALSGSALILQDKRVALTGYLTGKIHLFSLEGDFLETFPMKNGETPILINPLGLVQRYNGNILVTDPGNSRIVELNEKGIFLRTIKFPGLKYPYQVVNLEGKLVISDRSANKIHIVDESSKKVESYNGFQLISSSHQIPFSGNQGLTVDNSGKMYLVNTKSKEILVGTKNGRLIGVIKHPDFDWIRHITILPKQKIALTQFTEEELTGLLIIENPFKSDNQVK